MRAAVTVAGVLGIGSALVFAAAALTASMFPNGTVVTSPWGGGPWQGDWGGGAVPAPMPPGMDEKGVIVDGAGGVLLVTPMPVEDAAAP